ncbi:MAG TPA: flavin reductase family protein [Dehalococcoidia bacterium]|nr:flavin reductase family protein [Dehalococcoidia bacterium]
MPVSKDDFRKILGSFASGVTVITTNTDGKLHGMTASAFASLSLEPELVLICVDKAAASHDLIARSGSFAVNILKREQEEISTNFARKDQDRSFEVKDVSHRLGATGSPIFTDALAYLECRVANAYEGGDHTIYIGAVEDGGIQEGAPLLFFRGRYMGGDGA